MKKLFLLLITIITISSCNNNQQLEPDNQYIDFDGEIQFMSPDSGYHGYSYHITDTENRLLIGTTSGGSTTYSTLYNDSTFYKKDFIGTKRAKIGDNLIFPIYYKRWLNNQIVIDTTIYYQFHEGYNIIKLWY